MTLMFGLDPEQVFVQDPEAVHAAVWTRRKIYKPNKNPITL